MTRPRSFAAILLVVVTAAGWAPVEACGDKFLMLGRGARLQDAYRSLHPGKILIYTRPSTDTKAAIRNPQFHKSLRQAGHGVSIIEDWALLEQALKSVPVDVVLADVAEAHRLQPLASASPSNPTALYVLFPSNLDQSKILQQQYMCKLKASDRGLRYLDEIENAMKARAAAGGARKS
jgi:hypothetical protein